MKGPKTGTGIGMTEGSTGHPDLECHQLEESPAVEAELLLHGRQTADPPCHDFLTFPTAWVQLQQVGGCGQRIALQAISGSLPLLEEPGALEMTARQDDVHPYRAWRSLFSGKSFQLKIPTLPHPKLGLFCEAANFLCKSQVEMSGGFSCTGKKAAHLALHPRGHEPPASNNMRICRQGRVTAGLSRGTEGGHYVRARGEPCLCFRRQE